ELIDLYVNYEKQSLLAGRAFPNALAAIFFSLSQTVQTCTNGAYSQEFPSAEEGATLLLNKVSGAFERRAFIAAVNLA
ncbi:MAG: hypothetical protein DMG61_11790, partial [Acidobacteria bacterium]